MPSIFRFEPVPGSSTAAWRFIKHAIAVGFIFLLVGELWFRLPWTTKLVRWQFDDERGARLETQHSRGMALGNTSSISPPIGINRDGFRNAEIDWSKPTVLAVGSSELLAPGVEDDEVWTAIVTRKLAEDTGTAITVVNAGSAGYGPYHHAVTVRKFLETHPVPLLIVVRVSIGDRRFMKPSPAALEAARSSNEFSRRVKDLSEFLPFLVNRLEAQVMAMRNAFTRGAGASDIPPDHEGAAAADAMWQTHAGYWQQIVSVAGAAGVRVMFFVDAGDGSASGVRLHERLSQEFGGRKDVVIAPFFGPQALGLVADNDTERRRLYEERFTLGYDPHANAARHERVARFLLPLIEEQLSLGRSPG
jgi:hypothetical protein